MRKSLAAVLTTGLALSLAACSGGATPSNQTAAPAGTAGTSSAPASAPADAGTLLVWADDTRTPVFKQLGEDFKAKTGITLDVVQKPSGDISKDFITQAPSGEGPDLIVTAHDGAGELVKNGVVAPVELGDKVAGLSDASKNAFTVNGQLYGIPYAIENIALVRNDKLATDTPATFDELLAAGKDNEYPILIQQGEKGDAYHLYPIQSSFGAPVFKQGANGEFTNELGMEGPEGVKFAEYLKKLASAKAVDASIGADQAKQAFLDGKSPYMITGPWNIKDFQNAGMQVSVHAIPSAGGQPAAPFLGVQGVYLSSKSKNALLGNQFLDYIASDEAQQKLFDLGARTPASEKVAGTIKDPILAGFAEAGKDGQPMPAIPEMTSVWNFWGNSEIAIITGKAKDPAAEWKSMNDNIKASF